MVNDRGMQRPAVLGSIAMHAVLAIAIIAVIANRDEVPAPPAQPKVDLVDVQLPPAPPPSPAATGGGGGAPVRVASAAPKHVARAHRAQALPKLGELAIEQVDAGGTGGEGGGTGGGIGNGHGRGIGLGDGAGIEVPEIPAPPPPPIAAPVRVSKARPARLIYPSRERDAEDGTLFVARVIVDTDGYVAGARLVRGFGGPRDTEAADLIWRFRYDPALDDDGRPIRSTLDQRFLVNR
jgi:hypothetical protein